jgi:hypothetical protein
MVRKNAGSSLGIGRAARLLSIPLIDKDHRAAYRDYVLISTFTEGYIPLGWHHWYRRALWASAGLTPRVWKN